jgi:hypothetical protein
MASFSIWHWFIGLFFYAFVLLHVTIVASRETNEPVVAETCNACGQPPKAGHLEKVTDKSWQGAPPVPSALPKGRGQLLVFRLDEGAVL